MDELIRQLRTLAREARQERDQYTRGSWQWDCTTSRLDAYNIAIDLALAAQRRMAEREPAWDVQP